MVSRVVGEQPLSEVNSEQEVRSLLPHLERGPAPLGVELDQLAAGERHAALPRLEARAVPHRLAAREKKAATAEQAALQEAQEQTLQDALTELQETKQELALLNHIEQELEEEKEEPRSPSLSFHSEDDQNDLCLENITFGYIT